MMDPIDAVPVNMQATACCVLREHSFHNPFTHPSIGGYFERIAIYRTISEVVMKLTSI
ncbi:hypothetical protein [Ralstonia sp. Ralssp110]|uniref:hypothetical protein n=1 Tax=Ralstonia sp. Ralssp110 TaxID=3243004 RepID=UPI0039B66A9A